MFKVIPESAGMYAVNENGDVINMFTKKFIVGDINSAGYYRVSIVIKGKKKKYFRHRLVATMFLDNPEGYLEVNHIDGDKSHNNVSNLEWCDRIHNQRHFRRHADKGYTPFYIVSDGQKTTYEFIPDLANELHVTRRCVLNWLQKRSYGYKKHNISEIEYIKA